MKTQLDEGNGYWFFDGMTFEDKLIIHVTEGVVDGKPQSMVVGDVTIDDLKSINRAQGSRVFRVTFQDVIAWQSVDESFTTFDESEVRDDTNFIQILSDSAYMRYVDENHGWYRETVGKAKHYRLWTNDQVFDVVSLIPPAIEEWTEQVAASGL